MENEIQLTNLQPTDMAMGVFSSVSMYQDYYRIAKDLASSTLIPDEFRNKPSNVMIALNLSSRMGADPLAIMQSMYIVHGKPSFSASFIAGIVEQSGKFGFLEYVMSGDEQSDDYGCRINTTVSSTGNKIEGPLITIRMAKAEGWYQKKGSKWPNMREHMLQNRAVTFFARRYAGSVLLGMNTTDELEDIQDINPIKGQPAMSKADIKDSLIGETEIIPKTDEPKKGKPVEVKKEAEPVKEKKEAEKTKEAATLDQVNPFTLQDLLEEIEDAKEITEVNVALDASRGFSKEDSNKVLKAASAKNKILAAALKDKQKS